MAYSASLGSTENLDGIEIETDSIQGEVRSIVESSDDSRPSSSLTNYSVDSQDVRQF